MLLLGELLLAEEIEYSKLSGQFSEALIAHGAQLDFNNYLAVWNHHRHTTK